MTTPIAIKFPLVKERTGWKSGPRFHRIPAKAGLSGARACVALSLIGAVHKRDWLRHKESNPLLVRSQRLQMRMHALWARVFAGHFTAQDPRLLATEAAYHAASTAIMAELSRIHPIAA
jgi:hypothetical protein